MMRMTTAAAALAGGVLAAGAAGAVSVVSFVSDMQERFEAKRAIVEAVQAAFGETAAYADDAELPESVAGQIRPGDRVPEDVAMSDPPAALGDLPKLGVETEWKAVGDHLLEVGADRVVVMAVYDVLP